jgi:hypothetical protein
MDWHTVAWLSPHMHQTREGYVVIRDAIVARTGMQPYLALRGPASSPDWMAPSRCA